MNCHFFETMSKLLEISSKTQVKHGIRFFLSDKVLHAKLGRDDLCPCRSGKRFKECCLRKGCF